jgi:hypothetical protein
VVQLAAAEGIKASSQPFTKSPFAPERLLDSPANQRPARSPSRSPF